MFFPESLLQLSARDSRSTWLDPIFAYVTGVAGAAATLTTLGALVPFDKVLILQTCFGMANAGGAQLTTHIELFARPPATTLTDVLFSAARMAQDGTEVSGNSYHRWGGSLLVPPNWRLGANGFWSAGVAANRVDIGFTGILIPAANVQRV